MSSSRSNVILIEFNELTPQLMHRFMDAGELPNFQRFFRESQVYATDAEEEGENLNPWVQWVSVHNGLSAIEHGVFRLSEGHRLRKKAVWDVVSESGKTVWVCGSMNARYDQPLKGCLIPDPWSTGLTPYPEREFQDYYRFVRTAVQEHSRTDSLTAADSAKFVWFMLRHGLSFRTVVNTLRQLWTEKATRHYRWKRAAIMDQFQWDVFESYYRRLQPDLSTFFLNSTAHFQHCYWRNLEPELYKVKPAAEEQQEYGDAIKFGYQQMDAIIGKFLALAGPRTTLMFCTGLSQQPFLKFEDAGGRHYYRLLDTSHFGRQFDVRDPFEVHPVMADQFCLRFAEEQAAQRTLETLQGFRVGDKRALHLQREGADLMVQCNLTDAVPADAVIRHAQTDRKIPFFEAFYALADLKSAYHHPEGMLWVRRPDREHRVHEEPVSLMSIAPAVLELLDLAPIESMMREPFTRRVPAAAPVAELAAPAG